METKGRGRPKGSKDKVPRDMSSKPWEKSPMYDPEIGTDIEVGEDGKGKGKSARERNIELINELYFLTKIDISSVDMLSRRIAEYLNLCKAFGAVTNVTSLAFAIGIDRRRLWEIVTDSPSTHRIVNELPGECRDTLKKAYRMAEMAIEMNAQSGATNPVFGMFQLKNNHAWRDQQDIVLTPGNPLGEITDPEALRQRYLDAAPDIEVQKE